MNEVWKTGRPTIYRGIRMRSRLEADFAAALDRHDQLWEYEPDCFAGDQGQWLPDFGCRRSVDDPLALFIEVKPAGVLQRLGVGSPAYVEHADGFLRQMEVAWESRPDLLLSLVFWQYGAREAHLCISCSRIGGPWLAQINAQGKPALWPGMGQLSQTGGV